MEDIRYSISADFELKRQDGSLVDSSQHSGAINFIEGFGMMMPGIENALKGLKDEEEFNLSLVPEEMFGARDEEKLLEVSTKDFHGKADELEKGMIIEADGEDGLQLMTVVSIDGEKVILDRNHPLAGMTLQFSGKVINARPATEEEIDKLSSKGCGCGDHEDGQECCGEDGHGDEGCDEGCSCH
ncbi:MAG: hypothetical protein B6241_14310 [Spirochaetaceae bacterium 4572_59]|nr:MAG: hypothetical protein B6241_14310 [Spirochaetaceae bacterium 4572_59]